MKKILLLVAALALVGTACGDDDQPAATTTAAPTTQSATTTVAPSTESPTTTPAPTTRAPATTAAPTTEAPPAATTVQISASDLGDILTDAAGNTLYLFTPDNQGPSVCNDACADAWPPIAGEAVAGAGVDAGLLGTADRSDGTAQATYNGWPLYYFAGDPAAGDTNGQAVNNVWWVIDAAGKAILSAEVMAATVQISTSGLGDILTDAAGNTLYLFTPDTQGPSVCNDACAEAWPPFEGEAMAGSGVDESLLGTADRQDGKTQATYNGWPIYYYALDVDPGDTNGQAVGGVWWVIDSSGNAVTDAAAAAAAIESDPAPLDY